MLPLAKSKWSVGLSVMPPAGLTDSPPCPGRAEVCRHRCDCCNYTVIKLLLTESVTPHIVTTLQIFCFRIIKQILLDNIFLFSLTFPCTPSIHLSFFYPTSFLSVCCVLHSLSFLTFYLSLLFHNFLSFI